MPLTRRSLVLSAAGILGVQRVWAQCSPRLPAVEPASKSGTPLRILFLGGTGFIGPHMVQRALDRGHTVTLFSRGKSGNDLFPGVERLKGDRDGQLDALRGKTWDVVIDNSGYVPAHVRASAELLKGLVGHYLFTSTSDAYRDYHKPNIDESYPLATLPAGAPHDPGKYYGALKAICEEIVASTYPNRHTIIRPVWVVGPGDTNHVLTYWVMRLDRGGEVLAPGTPNDPAQVIDARDMAAWVINLVETQKGGRYNAAGPQITISQLLYGAKAVTSTPSTFTWVDADFLNAHKVKPYFDMPLWCPPRNDFVYPDMPAGLQSGVGALNLNEDRARATGLTHRPLADIAGDTLRWYKATYKDWPDDKRLGLSVARERELLAAWKAKS